MIAVLDANVALKWQFEDEEATSASTALLGDFIDGKIDLVSLTLFPYEIVNAINVAIDRKEIEEVIGYSAITYLTSLGIELRSFDELIEPTFTMARKYSLSPHDCAYMALAEKERCDFFTGDKRLFHSSKNYFSWIKWIGDYRPL